MREEERWSVLAHEVGAAPGVHRVGRGADAVDDERPRIAEVDLVPLPGQRALLLLHPVALGRGHEEDVAARLGAAHVPLSLSNGNRPVVQRVAPAMSEPSPVRELRLALVPDDLDAALALFRDALGLPVVEAWGEGEARGVVLGAGRATLELLSPAEARRVDEVEQTSRPAGRMRVALEVEDAAAAADALVAAGAELLGGPVVTPWEHRNVRLATPDGLQLTLFSPA